MNADSGGLGDMHGISQRCQGCSWFTSIDLASGVFELPIAKADRNKMTFRGAFGQLWQHMRCGFGQKILQPAFASMVAECLNSLRGKGVDNTLTTFLSTLDTWNNTLPSSTLSSLAYSSPGCQSTLSNLDGVAQVWNWSE